MASQLSAPDAVASAQCPSTASLQRLVLEIDENRMRNVAYRAELLRSEDSQLVVNFLSKALKEDGVLSNNMDRALPLLAKIASSTNTFPTHCTFKSLSYEPKPAEEGGNVHYGKLGVRVQVIKQSKGSQSRPGIGSLTFREALVTWAHLSHPNILPLFGVFLESEKSRICLVYPWTTPGNISTYSKQLPQALRMPLISDLTNGLCYLHQLNIVHGGLNPQAVLVSHDRRALIADLDVSSETQEPSLFTARYLAPEVLEQDNTRQTIAADMWSFGCVLYEVLSGNIPFCQYRTEARAAVAVARGEKPPRPSHEGAGGDEIGVTMWHSMLRFWEIEPSDRTTSLKFREILSHLGIRDDRPEAEPATQPRDLELMDMAIDSERAQAILAQLFPPVIPVPERLQSILSGLMHKDIDDATAAIEKVCHYDSDIQTLLDFLELGIQQDILSSEERVRVRDLCSRIQTPTLKGTREDVAQMRIENDRLEARDTSVTKISHTVLNQDVDMHRVEVILHNIQSELLQRSLSVIVLNNTNDVATAVAGLHPSDVRIIVDFLDLSFSNDIALSEKRDRILVVLSRISSSTQILPQRLQAKRVSYEPPPMVDGALGTLYRGVSDPDTCVKVMTRIDPGALATYMEKLITWAHLSHPNILSFCGLFFDESQRICVVSPFMKNGNLQDFTTGLPQEFRWLLLLDVIKGLNYLHDQNIVHGDLKPGNILISDERRALIADFGASHVITSTSQGGATTTSVVSTLGFTSPEIVMERHPRPGQEVDIWSFGCLVYEVLSRKLPYFEYGALARGQPPMRPVPVDSDEHDWDEIDDPSWDLIRRCCAPRPEDRPSCSQIQELIAPWQIRDDRPEAKGLHGVKFFNLQSNPELDWDHVDKVLRQIQLEILHSAISKLVQSHTKELANAIERLGPVDKRNLVDYLDAVLANHIDAFEKRNRILALLSRIAATALIFPRRHELEVIEYQSARFSEGRFATVHRGLQDPNICVKVTGRIDRGSHIKELISWAHLSHPNILPFCGAFFNKSQELCLVSPYMKNGNLGQYAFNLSQRSRVPLLSDIIDGLEYLHNMGIVHSDLKPANVLISDDGRALIADHGSSHVTTASIKQNSKTATPVNYTLRYMAPEIVAGHRVRPTKMADIWSFGCLCYHVLSRKVPYYQYYNDGQINFALLRKEPPMRPRLVTLDHRDETDDFWDEEDEEGERDLDLEDLNDTLWYLIERCCKPQPGDRPTIPDIQKLIADMKIEDSRPEAKEVPMVANFKYRFRPEVDLHRVGVLLAQVQAQITPTRDQEDELV